MNKTKAAELLKNNGLWLVGCVLYAIGVNSFSVPNDIAQSGVTGVAVILNHLFDLPVGTVNFALNIPLLILMMIYLGKQLVARTLWVTILLSTALDVVAIWAPEYTGDKILAALFCGLFQGAGLGLIMITGATSGGTDIVARLAHKRWPHITVGSVVLLADAIVVTAGMFVFGSIESGLYAIILIFVSTKVIDSMIYGTGNGKMLMIVTEKADEVSQAIVHSSPRGVSIIPAVGAYTGKDKNVLLCVARKHEISGIIKTVKAVDDKTFIIVSEANEILGQGFKKTI
ncbi:MAG: YitT family protein [Clostridia bacterium]|nr:YitT family protein [Clostridia bacterium]